ncbi:hypothetical protein HCG49_15140 [Arenibacter sp. 6A1]|uniref:hypothetical protein n=1 Tax=Arenibacter sp. 6A1 TaxID=2720391 RepID=UPI001446A9B0|nr:hypothetical protein [Arenibacter sp. 6A1]NKI27896.1 hypothetical protein [Arenibacter sp. 6A1]
MKTNNIKVAMKNTILRPVMVLILIGMSGQVLAQSNHEVSFYLQGSFSKLRYEALEQKNKLKNGFGIGTRYAYYFFENWSLGTGAELQFMKGAFSKSNIQGAYMSQDSEDEEFEFRYRAGNFSENQEVYFLNIPFQIQYESLGMTRFYAVAGVKAGFVLASDYQSLSTSLQTSGYYEQYDAELTEPKFAGFGEFGRVKNSNSELDLKTNIVAHLESGIKLILENKRSLYMGLFLDYGLNDIKPNPSRERIIEYNNQNPTAYVLESLLSSRRDVIPTQHVEKVCTIAFGLRIQYAFEF